MFIKGDKYLQSDQNALIGINRSSILWIHFENWYIQYTQHC